MKSFEATESLVKDGMLEEIGAREAQDVVGGALVIVVCIVAKDAAAAALDAPFAL